MKKCLGLGLIASIALNGFSPIAAPAFAAAAPPPTGVWYNSKNNVHIQIQPCGSGLCGAVVWANARAVEKARRGGTPRLVGSQLFQNLKPQGPGIWSGRVYVPDLARTFSGTLRLSDADTMLAKGCLIGRILCKSQIWRRIP
jgi:uncharacterized protein (DUF2147 family)